MVEIFTKDVGEVKDIRKKDFVYDNSLESRNEKYIKMQLGLEE